MLKFSAYCLVSVVAIQSICFGQVARQRVGLYGKVSYGAVGQSNWSTQQGMRGDTILLSCEANPGEEIWIGAFPSYRDTVQTAEPGPLEGVGEWKRVPASRAGAANGYRSATLGSAGVSVKWRNRSGEQVSQTVQLFLPYEALGLNKGAYQLRYRIRVWVNGKVADDFYTDENRIVRNVGSDWREIEYYCALPNGPSVCSFRLIGTDDPPDDMTNE